MSLPTKILQFWFEDHGEEDWWEGGDAFDAKVREWFLDVTCKAEAGELWKWRATPEGRLAEILCLDQFTRQIYRGSSRAFACDTMALALTQEAIGVGADKALDQTKRRFLYMPFMHSESLAVHDVAQAYFDSLDNLEIIKFEDAHRAIIERFGRYPTRNLALGRVSTPEELHYLEHEQDGAV